MIDGMLFQNIHSSGPVCMHGFCVIKNHLFRLDNIVVV